MYSSDESGSEDLDQEIRLYTQLYFGSEVELDTNFESNTKKEFLNNDQQNKELISQLGSRSNSIKETEKFSSNFRNECENIVSLPGNPVNIGTTKTLSHVITSKAIDTLSKPLIPKKVNTQLKIVPPKKAKVDSVNDAKKCKRKRNPSICSIDSISGREPLDNLYCTIDDEKLEIIEEDLLDEPHCDESFLANRSQNKSKLPENDPESKISEILKGSHSKKKKLRNEVDIDSSDDEICILPVSQRNKLPISAKGDSNDGIEIIKCIKHSNKKRKKKKNVVSKLKQKNSSFGSPENRSFQPLSVYNSPGSVSDSENEILEMSPKTPVVFKLGSKICSTAEKKKTLGVKKISKSCVIFSKNRPLTKRTPSCHHWTPEMASFYDSDYSDEFSVEDIHYSQNQSPRLWKICNQDKVWVKKTSRRYFDDRCTRCKDFGHLVGSCPRIPHCLFCASPDHDRFNCPKKCCFYCGKEPHKICNLAFASNTCSECMQRGHVASICPDLWRRFHATTSGTVPVVPDKPSKRNRKNAYCYNCAKKGHFGHECTLRNDVNAELRLKFYRVSTQVFNYDTQNLFPEVQVIDLDNEDDVEILPSAKKFVTDSSVDNYANNGITIVNECPSDITTSITISPIQVKMFVDRKRRIEKEIGKLVKSGLEYITLRKKENKIAFKGPPMSVQYAKKIARLMTLDPLNYRYKLHIRKFNKEQKMILKHKKTINQYGSTIYEERKPVKILIESGFSGSVLSSKGKDVGTKNKNEVLGVGKNDCLTSSAPLMPSKMSTGVLNNKKSYLPFPLPFSKSGIENAFTKILMCVRSDNLLSIVEEVFLNSSRSIKSIISDPDFFYNFQLLACVAHYQLKQENKSGAVNLIERYKNEFRFFEDDTISEELYKKISMSYSKVASPDVKHIFLYLDLAKKFKKSFTTSTPLKPSKVSMNDLSNQKSYLPFPLPFSKGEIHNALMKALVCVQSNNLLETVDKVFLNSNRKIESLYSEPDFLYNFQLLACVAHYQLYQEKKPCAITKIKEYRHELVFFKEDTISRVFHKKISLSYSEIASPDVEHIYSYLELAKKFKDTFMTMNDEQRKDFVENQILSELKPVRSKKKKKKFSSKRRKGLLKLIKKYQ